MATVRQKMQALCRETIADEAAHHTWTYDAIRPMPVPPSWKAGQDVRGDCSKGDQYIARWSGAPDPMARNFDEWGNSQTMTAHLPFVDTAAELEVGDYITFGLDGEDHATIVMTAGKDPLLWSFGHQGAPNSYRLSADTRIKNYRRNPVPKYVPTPAEKLRELTGYWAWLQWRLGEGHWKAYKPRDRKVRPNVPHRIPLSWFRRYARYLKNRKRASNPPTTP